MVKVHKKFKKLLAGVMAAMLLLSMTTIPASAGGILGDLEMETSAMNELSARAAINSYFSQRYSFLRGDSSEIGVANPAMEADESILKEKMLEEGYVITDYHIAVEELSCWDKGTHAYVTETTVFEKEQTSMECDILHEIHLYINADGEIKVGGDGYRIDVFDFSSCSYVSADVPSAEEVASRASGRSACMVAVAVNEIGYQPVYGKTKYGEWYGYPYGEWCAMFVSWCGNQASISTYDLAPNSTVQAMKAFFESKNAYMPSASQGGTYTPKAGDVFFQFGDSPNNPTHVGIVRSVSGNTIYLIDGNCEDTVNTHTYNIGTSLLVAYGSVSYAGTSHAYGNYWKYNETTHWKTCVYCGLAPTTPVKHLFTTDPTTGKRYCTICNYGALEAVKNVEMH